MKVSLTIALAAICVAASVAADKYEEYVPPSPRYSDHYHAPAISFDHPPSASPAEGHYYEEEEIHVRPHSSGREYAAPYAEPSRQTEEECTTTYETTYSDVCANEPERVCRTETTVEYRSERKRQCRPDTEKKCRQVTRRVPDRKCSTTSRRVCKNVPKTVYEVETEHKCERVPVTVCPRPEPPVYHHRRHHGYGRRYHYGGHRYRREADKGHKASGAPYGCRTLYDVKCVDLPKKVPRTVEVPHCKLVPETKCVDSHREVKERECRQVPTQHCEHVTVKVPVKVPVERCEYVPNEVCKQVAQTKPKKLCRKKSVAKSNRPAVGHRRH